MSNVKKSQKNVKETNTLDNKHKQIVKQLSNDKNNLLNIENEINEIEHEIQQIGNKNNIISYQDIQQKALLLDKKRDLEFRVNNIKSNYNEMDYYDMAGDLITDYYHIRDNNDDVKASCNIIDFLCKKKEVDTVMPKNNRANLFEKYCQRIDGVRINHDDGSKRIKYCNECNIEKTLDLAESAYICPCCGDLETVILDEDKQIKDYSPYKRLNHFREWLNQFQAKQSPDIPESVFRDIFRELKKSRINDLSKLSREVMKNKLKKLKYNNYYEHIHYIINKLNNLPPPKVTRDMEKVFISMFIKIQEPWEIYKPLERKNFLSYSYVLHKFCELLELDHLLNCFPLHKDPDKIMENDETWEKICKHLNWQYISSFK